MRNRMASCLLIASVFIMGIWCGGQMFNELMIVPKWSAAPPASLKTFAEFPSKGGLPFFPLFNPLFALLAICAAIAAWKTARRSRLWLALSAGTSLAVSVSLIAYLAPLVGSMFQHSIAGDLPAAEIVAGVEQWKTGNRIRLVVELCAFLFSIIALKTWSSENAAAANQAGAKS